MAMAVENRRENGVKGLGLWEMRKVSPCMVYSLLRLCAWLPKKDNFGALTFSISTSYFTDILQ